MAPVCSVCRKHRSVHANEPSVPRPYQQWPTRESDATSTTSQYSGISGSGGPCFFRFPPPCRIPPHCTRSLAAGQPPIPAASEGGGTDLGKLRGGVDGGRILCHLVKGGVVAVVENVAPGDERIEGALHTHWVQGFLCRTRAHERQGRSPT